MTKEMTEGRAAFSAWIINQHCWPQLASVSDPVLRAYLAGWQRAGSQAEPKAPRIPTWRERCQTHPEHQDGVIITSAKIERRMQEEIDDLRAALERRQ